MRTRLSQFLEAVTVTAPTAIKEISSKLAVYANDAAYEAALGAGAEGDIYFNSTIQMLRIYKNSAWENFTADEIDYDNTISGLSAATVQDAIDEVNSDLSDHVAATEAHGIASGAAVMGTYGSTLDAVFYGIADDASTGTDQTLTPTKINTRLTGVTGGDTLAGLVPTNTKLLVLINDTANSLSILNESAAATAANRILTGTGANLGMGAGTSITLIYDDTEARWRVVGGSGAGLSDPMSTRGDLIYRDPSNTTTRLATGILDQVLRSDGVDTYWDQSDGEFNYIANADAASGTGNTSTTANVTLAQTLVTAELPEPRKLTAFKVSASGAATDGSDYAQWDAKVAWADADKNIGALIAKVKATGGWKLVAWNDTDGVAMGPESVEITSDGPVLIEVWPLVDKFPAVRAIPTTGTPSDLFISGIKIQAKEVNPVGNIGKSTLYDPSNTQGFGTITSGIEWTPVGQKLEISGDFITGTVTASEAQIGLPDGHTVYQPNASGPVVVGVFIRDNDSTNAQIYHVLATHGDTYLNVSRAEDGTTTNSYTPANGDDVASSATANTLYAKVAVDSLIDNYSLPVTEVSKQNARLIAYSSATSIGTGSTDIAWTTVDKGSLVSSIEYEIEDSADYFIIAQCSGVTNIDEWAINLDTGGGYNQIADMFNSTDSNGTVSACRSLLAGDKVKITGSTSSGSVSPTTANFMVIRVADRSAQIPGLPFSTNATPNKQFLAIDYREDTYTFSNSGSDNINGTVKLVRVGTKVTANFNDITHDSAASVVSDAWIPSGYTPYVGSGTRVSNIVDTQTTHSTFAAAFASGIIQITHRDWTGTTTNMTGVNYGFTLEWTTTDD
jgi:hypothetical protein